MKSNYIAHISEATGEIQTIKEHSENTAELCRRYAVSELGDIAYAAGLIHDIGKFQVSFQKKIHGENLTVEHSTCGALEAKKKYERSLSLLMGFCIAGHHGGIPDGGSGKSDPSQSTLGGRLAREFEPYDDYQKELELPYLDRDAWISYLAKDCEGNADKLIDKFAFLTRYVYSCLVDADTADTAAFCRETEAPRQLYADFPTCLKSVDQCLESFTHTTRLQKARSEIQQQAFENAKEDGEIYLLNMPTGSGKTLASIKIALEKAVHSGKKRIIYIIPFNGIIDQTAEGFKKRFEGNLEILRHQSTFSYEDEENGNEDYRMAAKIAAENWDSPFIITTAVQFFESIYSNKRSKLRKLHNMADSILVFDEAHLMPEEYLQPCLQAVAYITRYLNSQAIFLTATMPDYESLLRKYAISDSRIINLITDTSLFQLFRKCIYHFTGEKTKEQILLESSKCPSSLIIVNKKKTARELYRACVGKKFHLSTYMTADDRIRVLRNIRDELQLLDKDYPGLENVPENRRITIISTSLIEAGVDLDVHTVFRELNGLDSILQAGGRCNREGKRESADVFVFELLDEEDGIRRAMPFKYSLTQGLMQKYKDIAELDCIREYYRRIYDEEKIQQNTMHGFCSDISSIPFRTYAEKFRIIDDKNMSVIVPRDEKSRKLVDQLRYTGIGNTREFQKYACTVTRKELEDLVVQNAADDFKTGIFCLLNEDYYDKDLGITFEATDYFL